MKRERTTLARPVEDLGKVTARGLLDGHRHGKKAQILHVDAFGHCFQRFANITAIGGFVRNHAHFRAQRIGHFLGHDLQSAAENG